MGRGTPNVGVPPLSPGLFAQHPTAARAVPSDPIETSCSFAALGTQAQSTMSPWRTYPARSLPGCLQSRKCNFGNTVNAAACSCSFLCFSSPLSSFGHTPELALGQDKAAGAAGRWDQRGSGHLCWVISGPQLLVGFGTCIEVSGWK